MADSEHLATATRAWKHKAKDCFVVNVDRRRHVRRLDALADIDEPGLPHFSTVSRWKQEKGTSIVVIDHSERRVENADLDMETCLWHASAQGCTTSDSGEERHESLE